MIKKLFSKRYSKWVPFAFYGYGSTDFLVMIRSNLSTGMIYFKTKQIQGKYSSHIPDLEDRLKEVQNG